MSPLFGGNILNSFLCWFEQHQGLGSWMQAVFSFSAIIAAYFIGRHQFNHEREAEKQRKLELLDSLLMEVYRLAEKLKTADEGGNKKFIIDFDGRVLGSYEAAIGAIPFMEIPHQKLVIPICNLPHAISLTVSQI
ncbi:hypothetical protein [Ralstonia pseudosolanacearum]